MSEEQHLCIVCNKNVDISIGGHIGELDGFPCVIGICHNCVALLNALDEQSVSDSASLSDDEDYGNVSSSQDSWIGRKETKRPRDLESKDSEPITKKPKLRSVSDAKA